MFEVLLSYCERHRIAALMRNRYLAVPALLLALVLRVSATTVVIAVTPSGIVIGADSKGTPTGAVLKIVLLKGKFIIASLYAEKAKSDDTGAVLYDFPSWINEIDKQTDAKASVTSLTDFISQQLPRTFSFAIDS